MIYLEVFILMVERIVEALLNLDVVALFSKRLILRVGSRFISMIDSGVRFMTDSCDVINNKVILKCVFLKLQFE